MNPGRMSVNWRLVCVFPKPLPRVLPLPFVVCVHFGHLRKDTGLYFFILFLLYKQHETVQKAETLSLAVLNPFFEH